MRQLFLYGGYDDNFADLTRPFITAAGGSGARIALLFPSPESVEKYIGFYRDQWLPMGAAEIMPVVPGVLGPLRACTGIFMCGGDTRRYHEAYATGEARQLIRDRYREGVPYAGLSAGALLATSTSSVWGDRLTTAANVRYLRGSEEGCTDELEIREGLGLLPGFMTEAHFSQQGGFTRLATALDLTGVPRGLGMDDAIGLHIEDETRARVLGRGLAFSLTRLDTGRVEVQLLEPGTAFDL